MSTFKISGSTAFVTGTNKANGIGRAVVNELLAGGAKKVYATARDASQLDSLVKESDGRVEAVQLDVTDPSAISKLGAAYPDVNLVVNNAGVFSGANALNNAEAAANEIAVAAFLDSRIRFTEIPAVIEGTLERVQPVEPVNLDVVETADNEARAVARGLVADTGAAAPEVSLA